MSAACAITSKPMDAVSKTLYIPLYGKAKVSRQGIILHDPKAEEIWDKVSFPLTGKAASRWLSYYMSMRARVFDDWTAKQIAAHRDFTVLHIGCGLDSRVLRIGAGKSDWYDIDLPAVIEARKGYFQETPGYHMLVADAARPEWVKTFPKASGAIVVLEGLSMYLTNEEVTALLSAIREAFPSVQVLMDVYTPLAAMATRYKNPINQVGVTQVYGIARAEAVMPEGMAFLQEHSMTPRHLAAELSPWEKVFFQALFAGKAAKKLYRLFEYASV